MGERDAGVPDLAFRPHDPLRERRLRHQVRRGDLGRGEASHEPESEGDLGIAVECGVAAQEHEPKVLVADIRVLDDHVRLLSVGQRDQVGGRVEPAPLSCCAAQAIHGAVVRDRVQPARWIGGHGLPRRGGEQGILNRLVCQVEVAEAVREKGEDVPALLAREAGDLLVEP